MVQLTLDGELTDHQYSFSHSMFQRFFRTENDYYLQDLRAAFRHLANDRRVKGVQISMRALDGSFANFVELRRILSILKTAKKPLYFYLESADDKALYLASIGDRVALAPTSDVMIPGPTFNLMCN